jgi:hypothetical protein
MMKRALIAVGLTVVSFNAFAGKAEREYMKDSVQPAIKEAETKFKAACGCALKITATDSLKSQDDMAQAKNTANSVAENAEKYCTDDASKKAVCQMKSIDVVKGKETAFTFKAGKGTCTTDGNSYVHWDMITRELDK